MGAWFREAPPGLESRIAEAQHLLQHRGPDDRGSEILERRDGVMVLGHTRLSIIDLSRGGHQPMSTRDGRYRMVYNGEVYNYRELRQELVALGHEFRSDSDTEVLLESWARWGEACLPRLKGMFAFVVFDTVAGTLTCARDPFGIKPLFYSNTADSFAFASEAPALLRLVAATPAANPQRAYDYLVHGSYDDREETFFQGIRHLLPGHVLSFTPGGGGGPTVRRWWWPPIAESSSLSFPQATERLREMFLENVRLHLRSDVPLGAALSGGIDSSAVVCAMRLVQPDAPLHTFSYVARGSREDEEPWVDAVNEHVGAIPHKVLISPTEMAADLDDMIRAQGEPFGSTSIYAQYRVFQLARENGVTVTLDGQGADEMLGGYHGYPGSRLRSLVERGRLLQATRFASAWADWPGRTPGFALMDLGDQLVPERWRGTARSLVGRSPEPSWLDLEALRAQGVRCVPKSRSAVPDGRGRRLPATLRRSLAQDGLPGLLRFGDRNAMRWTVESRVPFLTGEMASFLLSLPEDYLVSPRGETKRIFRAAMRGIVPDAVLDRRDKIGFRTPERDWLQVLGPTVHEWIEGLERVPFLKPEAVKREVDHLIAGRRPFSFQAWRMINYSRWLQIFGAG